MKNVFVIQTNDEDIKEALNEFLALRCGQNKVDAVVYELNEVGAKKVLQIVNERETGDRTKDL